MSELEPICATCYAPMRIVDIHHKHRPTTRWPLCPHCLTTRHLDLNDTPIESAAEPPARHLRAVP